MRPGKLEAKEVKLEAKEEPAAAVEEPAAAVEDPAAAAATQAPTAAKSSYGGNTFFPGPYGGDSFGKGKTKGWEEGFAAGKGKGKSKGWEEGFKEGRVNLFSFYRRLSALGNTLEELKEDMENQIP